MIKTDMWHLWAFHFFLKLCLCVGLFTRHRHLAHSLTNRRAPFFQHVWLLLPFSRGHVKSVGKGGVFTTIVFIFIALMFIFIKIFNITRLLVLIRTSNRENRVL
jgi:hypothetical protein